MVLKQLTTLSAGHPFRGAVKEAPGSGTRVVQMKNVSTEWGVDWSSVIETQLTGRKIDRLSDGDVLFAARGARNHAVLVEQCPEQVVASPHFYVLRVVDEAVSPEYLAWFLNQAPTQRYFQREAEGTRMPSIRRAVLENTPIAVPALDKQRNIVALASTLRHEQEIANQLVRNGETMMDAIATDLLKQTSAKG